MTTTTFKRILLAGVAFAGTAIGQSAFAQAAAKDDDGAIIVTARRMEERLQDVPISISVVSSDQITKRNLVNATELANFVPSLSSNSNFGPEKSSFAIRGFTQEGKTSPSVGVYFAEVVAPRANGGTTSGNGAGPGSFFDLENIQVLKGPQGTLFGRNTTGGAILLTPAKPKGKLEASLEGSIGNYNMHRVQGMLNVPLSDNWKVRGAFDWMQRDGYLKNISGIGPDRFGNTNYFAGRISIVGQITPDIENYTIASYSNSHNNGVVPNMTVCDSAPTGGLPYVLAPFACAQIAREKAAGGNFYTVESTATNPYQRTRQWGIINTTTWQASDSVTVKNIFSYQEYRESSEFSLWGSNFLFPVAPGFNITFPTIQLDPGPSGNNSAQSTLTDELQIHGHTADGKLDWQAGAYLESSKPLGYSSGAATIFLNCTNVATFACSNPLQFGSISSYNIKDTYNNKGFYAQANYKITDKLTFTGGIRYTIDKMLDDDVNVNVNFAPSPLAQFTCQNILTHNNGTLTNPIPVAVTSQTDPTCRDIVSFKTSRPTWLLNLDYKFTPDMMGYIKWARGYRQGAINPNNLGFPSWGPEKVDTYEAGLKTSFAGAMPGYFNVAAYYNNFRDQQLAVNTVIAPAYSGKVPPQQLVLNAGKSRIWGIEVDASVKPFPGFKLDVGYAYLNTKLISFTIPALPVYYSSLTTQAQIGGPLSNAPKNRITLSGTYTLPLDEKVGTVSLSATFTHTDANRAVSPESSPFLYMVPASNLLNMNLDWKSVFGRPIDLGVFVTNLTDQHHLLAPDSAFTTIGGEGGHPELPRMFGMRLKVHYN
ncbi:MAG: TonB-dependent receptor [Sphingomonadales bacterium]|nr:TonB-dependent receptor [Sphingomonadales bacterium]